MIREVTDQDIEDVEKLEAAVFADAWSANSLRESLEQSYTLLLGTWEDEKLVGYVIFYMVADDGEIARIAVDKDYRRRGIAKRLLWELENGCERRGILRLILEVRKGNREAIKFYKDYGFTEDGIRQKYYSNPQEDAILMSYKPGRTLPKVTALSTRKEEERFL